MAMTASAGAPPRAAANAAPAHPPAAPPIAGGDLSVVRRLLPYLWEFRGRVLLALAFLIAAKLANISVPLVMKGIVDGLSGDKALLSFMIFSVLPTLLEMALVTGFLIVKFDVWFGVITVAAILLYVGLTFLISEWRTAHRRQMNEMDSKANTKAIDSLLNYETVKYFGNERYE